MKTEQYRGNILHFSVATSAVLLVSRMSSRGFLSHTEQSSLTAGFIINVTVYLSEDATDLSVT